MLSADQFQSRLDAPEAGPCGPSTTVPTPGQSRNGPSRSHTRATCTTNRCSRTTPATCNARAPPNKSHAPQPLLVYLRAVVPVLLVVLLAPAAAARPLALPSRVTLAMTDRTASQSASASSDNECGGPQQVARSPDQNSVNAALVATWQQADNAQTYINHSVNSYSDASWKGDSELKYIVLQAWHSAYNNYTALDNDWHHHSTPECLLVNGVAVLNASQPTSIADQIDFLRDAAQRMKRVRDVIRTISMAAMERQGGQPDFLDRLHVFAKILSCELVTALRAAGDESKVDGCTETGSQDRLVEYLVVREFIDLLKHVIAGTKVLKQLSASAAVVEASAPPLPFM